MVENLEKYLVKLTEKNSGYRMSALRRGRRRNATKEP